MIRARPVPAIQFRWHQPRAALRVTIERQVGNRLLEREVGPRGLLDLDEAATILARPREAVQRSIHSGFLRAARRGRYPMVTLKSCIDFLAEERADGEAARRALARARVRGEHPIPADEVHRRLDA
jgi:hypothetical protein